MNFDLLSFLLGFGAYFLFQFVRIHASRLNMPAGKPAH